MERLWRIFALVAASAAIGYLTTAWVRDQMRPSAAIRTTSRLPDSRQADTASRFTSSRLAARVSSIARSCRAGLHRYAGAPPLTRASRERSSPVRWAARAAIPRRSQPVCGRRAGKRSCSLVRRRSPNRSSKQADRSGRLSSTASKFRINLARCSSKARLLEFPPGAPCCASDRSDEDSRISLFIRVRNRSRGSRPCRSWDGREFRIRQQLWTAPVSRLCARPRGPGLIARYGGVLDTFRNHRIPE